MKLSKVITYLNRHPYFKVLKESKPSLETAYSNMTKILSETRPLNYTETGQLNPLKYDLGFQHHGYSKLDAQIKSKIYLKDLTSEERLVAYNIAQQKIAELFNSNNADAYEVTSMRPSIFTVKLRSLEVKLQPLVKKLLVWFQRHTFQIYLLPLVILRTVHTMTHLLSVSLQPFITLKNIIVSGHTLNVALAALVRLRELLAQTHILVISLNPLVRIAYISRTHFLTTKLQATAFLRIFSSKIKEDTFEVKLKPIILYKG